MFYKKTDKEQFTEQEQTATSMDDLVSTAEGEYYAILQRWIDGKELTTDPARTLVLCELLKIPLSQVKADKEVLLKAKALAPEIAKKNDAHAAMEAYGKQYMERKAKYDAYSAKELHALSDLNMKENEHSRIWHRSMDAERELTELKTKFPRVFGLKPEVVKQQSNPKESQQSKQSQEPPMTVDSRLKNPY